MSKPNPQLKAALLRIIRDAATPIGSGMIAQRLREFGIALSPRSVRLNLEQLVVEGLITPGGRGRSGGRTITQAGLREAREGLVYERVGLMSSRVEELAWGMDFDLSRRRGRVVLNVSVIPERVLPRAFRELAGMLGAGLGMSPYVGLFAAGEQLGTVQIPKGHMGLGTVCSVALNGVLLAAGIPISPVFAAVLDLRDGVPVRFTDILHYDGTSLDPIPVFIKGGLLSVRLAAKGTGRLGVSVREAPAGAARAAERVLRRAEKAGLGRPLLVEGPATHLLGMPLAAGRTALVIPAGLNAMAAADEARVPVEHYSAVCLHPFEQLMPYREMAGELGIAL
ncbi:MAG: DUF128 domain-containing protein [Lentisphaerae bacterium]|jgi:HTH-type transcriptional regulator, global nitrogen regulator NrpRI|nr:DUF128 domain-containing protein [Lentisphaerota bacterium]MBT4814748.1 DUF128 domain-containing protein [Lentisphaerota bacterium]MBT5605776.1 DUF128 domain-containing protein [Lentisphaerota bacterium]MBT7055843.1 DUF128 domain-containing protein [Lentisphaerota bacterium]MBT7840952.1 DUF128 domain-containing protein [Lentisphaerota bacterium]